MGFSNPLVGRTLTAEIAGTVPVVNPPGGSLAALASTPVDFLGLWSFTGATHIGTPAMFLTPASAALHNYQTIAVQLPPQPVTAGITQGFCVAVRNTTQGIISAFQYQRSDSASAINPQTGPLFFPIAANPGDVIDVFVVQTFGPLDGPLPAFSVAVFGLGHSLSPTPLRPDGRSRPQGSLFTASQATGPFAAVAILPAPGAGLRYLIDRATLGGIGVQSYLQLNATINAGTGPFVAGVCGAANPGNLLFPASDNGLLCDVNTAVTITVTGAAAVIYEVNYDLVV